MSKQRRPNGQRAHRIVQERLTLRPFPTSNNNAQQSSLVISTTFNAYPQRMTTPIPTHWGSWSWGTRCTACGYRVSFNHYEQWWCRRLLDDGDDGAMLQQESDADDDRGEEAAQVQGRMQSKWWLMIWKHMASYSNTRTSPLDPFFVLRGKFDPSMLYLLRIFIWIPHIQVKHFQVAWSVLAWQLMWSRCADGSNMHYKHRSTYLRSRYTIWKDRTMQRIRGSAMRMW